MTEQGTSSGGAREPLPLLDRGAELDGFALAVDAAVSGQGRIVLVEGGPGAGKTRLLAEARRLALEAGMRVLTARGGEVEREYAYGSVRQLFEAALLGPGGATWLGGPAAAAASVFTPAAEEDAAAFATLNGLYWLTAHAAGQGPLALVVDDLHWVDQASLGFIQFLARRLEGLPLLLVIAGRPFESDELNDLAMNPAADVLRPAPLSDDAAAELSERLLGVRPGHGFADACRRATGGNPLLLVELLRALRSERIVPDDAHVDAIDHVGPSAVTRIVLVRLRRLPGSALAVAQALAVLGTGAGSSLLAELAEVDEPTVSRALEALIGAEIVDPRPPLGFLHPIMRDAIYRELTPDDRDRRHLQAAELLRARAAEPDQVGAHLLLTAPRGLTWIVESLQAAAADAARRGAIESAITFLRRALAERPGDAGFTLLFRLGMAEAAIDPRAAVDHLRAAGRAAPDERMRTRVGEMVTRILVFIDPPGAIAAARRARAELPAGADDVRAGLLAMEHHAARFYGMASEPYPDHVDDTPRGRMLRAVKAWELALGGGTAAECAEMAADVFGVAGHRDALGGDAVFTAMVASSVLIFADDRRAQGFWDEWYAGAVRAGRAHAVIAAGVWDGAMRLRLGELTEAEAAIRAVMEGPRDWGPGTETVPAHTLGTLAEVLIERGDLAGARAVLERFSDRLRQESEGALQLRCVELRLLAAEGHHDAVLERLEPIAGRLQTVRNPAWFAWRSVRAEALQHLGREVEAIAAAAEELRLARNWGTPGPIGRALRLLGVLEDRVDRLEQAVETTRDPYARLEHVRSLLALGQAVRRAGRPRDARVHLRDAHDLAARCGAEQLARLAREELATAGGRPRAAAGTGEVALTPSERRVAELAASGQTNREIAQQLFLSTKTIEVHLSSSYRKLGIRARRELASALEASTAEAV